MDLFDQLKLHSEFSNNEVDSERECLLSKHGLPVTQASLPNGKKIKLLKAMLTSACERNCNYCAFRAGRDIRRATFSPDDLARIYMQLYDNNLVEGLFLSSGIIKGGVPTQDKLIATAELLRKKYNYRGYLHLKIMPGIEKDQLKESMLFASRISINLEGPNDHRLSLLAPKKIFQVELIQPIKWASEIRRELSPYKTWNGRWPSIATQFVIGAVGESDLELMSTSSKLFRMYNLKRIFYSKFNPVLNTPFENNPPEDPIRKNRLYQASYLLRDYGFRLEEMPFNDNGFLPKGIDPKMAWARNNLKHNPIEINQASRKLLLKIPGIGLKSSLIILKARRFNRIQDLNHLKKIGIQTKRASEFILLDGKRPAYQSQLL